MNTWLSSVVEETKKQYTKLFSHELEPKISIIKTKDWEKELQKRNVKKRKSGAVYLFNEILLREDSTYFQVLHEIGHEAYYQEEKIKPQILEALKTKNSNKMVELEKKYPEEFLEQKADKYAQILNDKVKEKIPSLIYENLQDKSPLFVVMNALSYVIGNDNNINILLVNESEETQRTQYPIEWKVNKKTKAKFEEGIQNVDGIYLDIIKTGQVIYDVNNYSKTIQENSKKQPSKNEVIYHFNEANVSLFSAKKHLLQLNQLQQQTLYENGKNIFEIILSDEELLLPQYFFNELSHATSYSYLGKEYAKGNHPLISRNHPKLFDELHEERNTRKGIKFYKKIEEVQNYVKTCAREAQSYLKNMN